MRVLGVFIFGCALVLLYCLISVKRLRVGFLFTALIMSLAILVRGFGVIVDGTPLNSEMRLFIAEAVFLGLSLIGYFIESRKTVQ